MRMQLAWPAPAGWLCWCFVRPRACKGSAPASSSWSPQRTVTRPSLHAQNAALCCAVDEHKRPVDIPFELQPASEAECLRHRLAVQKRAERLALRDRMRQRKKVRYSLDGQERARWAAALCCCRSGV